MGNIYIRDFGNDTVDQQPAETTKRYQTVDINWLVRESIGEEGGKILELSYPSGSPNTNTVHGLSFNSVDVDANRANFEIFTRFKLGATTILDQILGISHGRGSGDVSGATLYSLSFGTGETLNIRKNEGSLTPSTIALENLSFTKSVDTWYNAVFQVRGNNLKGKIWEGDPVTNEPASWLIETTDNDITEAGRIGLFSQRRHENIRIEYDYVTIATGNLSAPRAPELTGLDAPTLTSPVDNATDQAINVTLQWGSVTGATSYDVQVSENSDMSSPVVNENIATNEYQTDLTYNKTYYWRVRARDGEITSPWSEIRAFTTVLGIVTLVSPNDAAVDVELPITFSWNALTDALAYNIQIAKDGQYLDVAIDETVLGTSYETSNLTPGETYYWRVRGGF